MPALTRRALLAAASGLIPSGRLFAFWQRKTLRFRITELSLLPDGDYSSVCAINNRGQAVGLCSTGKTLVAGRLRATRAVLWQQGTVQDLVGKQFLAPQAFRINNRSQILINWQYIGTGQPGSVPPQEDFVALWDGNMRKVWHAHDGFLPTNLNDHDVLVGYIPQGAWQAAFVREGKLRPIVFPPNVLSSRAEAVNDALCVVGTFTCKQDPGATSLFLFQEGRLDTVLANKLSADFYPAAINNKGQAAGTFREIKSRIAHLFVWENGQLQDRGRLGREGQVHSINSQGAIVGKADWGAFLATGGQASDLNAYVPKKSGWTFDAATGINDRMQIVGNGRLHGQYRAFLLTPAS